jgi:hypothetical protein
MAHRDAALKRMAAGPTPPGREHALREVLDRLGPSLLASLLDPAGVPRHANRAALQAAWPAARAAVAAAHARHRRPNQRAPLAAALARDVRRRLLAI